MPTKMTLEKISLRNFKGIRDFTLDASGENVKVYGDNATGKTTLFDAFVWLLFDKDSQNKKDFQIKTVDTSGQVIHGLEHEVEAVLSIDGKQTALRKVYTEKWTKKRGSAHQEMTGHTTKYFIDGVPSKKKEFTDFVAAIVDEDVFKLLTNPAYFNEQLHWQDRRKTLLEVCGDVSDEEVIASNAQLTKLSEILGGRSIDDHKKVIAAKRREINDQLEKIPVRIDEVYNGLPDVNGIDVNSVKQLISDLRMRKDAKTKELSAVQNGGQVAEKQKQLAEIETELIRIRNEHRQQNDDVITDMRNHMSNLKIQISAAKADISVREQTIERNKKTIEDLSLSLQQLRLQWSEIDQQQFTFEQDENCPSCGQSLPQEKLDAAREKALENFNQEKAQRLERINKQGQSDKQEKERLEIENNTILQDIEKNQKRIEQLQHSVNGLQEQIEAMQSQTTDINDNATYTSAQLEKTAIEQEIQQLKMDASATINTIQQNIQAIDTEIQHHEKQLALVDQYKRAQKRIDELKQQEKELATEFERLEEELYLTEEFTRTKVNLFEDRINSRFDHARFKLFREQVNGGLEEICETTYQGVPYSAGLNNAARINIGLDIINTLSDHYGFVPPIFIDNKESVTELIDTRGQLISLIVSEQDKHLRVEHEQENVKEAV